MKHPLNTFFVACFLQIAMACHSGPSPLLPETHEIEGVATEVKAISQSKSHFRKRNFDLVTGTDQGGRMEAYLDERGIRIIELHIGLSNRVVSISYVFRDSILIYYAERETRFLVDLDANVDQSMASVGKRFSCYFLGDVGVSDNQNFAHITSDAKFFREAALRSEDTLDIEERIKG